VDAELEAILDDEYLGDIAQQPLDQIRSMRAECQEVETQLSYLRRLVQGRHDIVGTELERRRQGGDPTDLSGLVGRLPEILADRIRAPGPGRLPETLVPREPSGRLADRWNSIVSAGHLTRIDECDEEQLGAISEQLVALEKEVSDLRRALFRRIDTLQAELTRRYRDGEAHVEQLLHDS